AHGESYPRRGSQNRRIGRGSGSELIGQRGSFGPTAEREQRPDLAEQRAGMRFCQGPRLPVALQRLAVQTPAGEDVAQKYCGRRGRSTSGHGAIQLGRGLVEQTPRNEISGYVQRLFGGPCAGSWGAGGGKFLEQLIQDW